MKTKITQYETKTKVETIDIIESLKIPLWLSEQELCGSCGGLFLLLNPARVVKLSTGQVCYVHENCITK